MVEVRKSRIKEGSPYPRGAGWDGAGTNFAAFSAHGTKVEVCIERSLLLFVLKAEPIASK
jgi:pullulanase/glycogen debranching enzyme